MSFEKVMTVLGILLLASASVERFLEILSQLTESIGLLTKKKKDSPGTEEKPSISKAASRGIENTADEDEPDTAEGDASMVVLLDEGPPKDREMITKKFVLQIGGCVLGVILCASGKLGAFKMLDAALGSNLFYDWLDYIFTGILIGSGTEPIHALIRFLQAKKDASTPPAPVEQPEPTAVAARLPDEAAAQPMIDIKYRGGVDIEGNSSYPREQRPDMIVYHHTGMHSDSTFMEVVNVFNAKGFRTGYHYLVTADGTGHNYCRWDARGIHAKGYNDRSLGLAFCGCFESDPDIPGSNPNGEMGNFAPTTKQLLTGSRIVALWSLLYDIDISKKDKLAPHKELSDTNCPGNNFPYNRFHELANKFRNDWRKSSKAISEMEDFKKKRYL